MYATPVTPLVYLLAIGSGQPVELAFAEVGTAPVDDKPSLNMGS